MTAHARTFRTWSEVVSQAIEVCGGTTALAKRMGLTKQSVAYWRRKGVPKRWRPAVCAIAGFDLPQQAEPGKPAPLSRPLCFAVVDWRRWRASTGGEPVSPCEDCTADYRARMLAAGRCDRPWAFREPADRNPPVQVWVEARFTR